MAEEQPAKIPIPMIAVQEETFIRTIKTYLYLYVAQIL